MAHSLWHSAARLISARSRRASSWDQSGGNDDCVRIDPGETRILAEIAGAGQIDHIYCTMIHPNPLDFRDAVLRMYWDGEDTPSVEAPFGDFFCVGHATVRRFQSLNMVINPGSGPTDHGFNCYFPMPFGCGARIELHNPSNRVFGGGFGRLWFHIDYHVCDTPPPDDIGRFHAQWRRENPTAVGSIETIPGRAAFPGRNLTGRDNYVFLEATGHGHLAGLFLQVDNLAGGWWGEGDDMLFIDGDVWPPSVHGTGTEEVFGGGACPAQEYAGPYTGFHLIENKDGQAFYGKNAMYRWYDRDPVRFTSSIRAGIEHGHANDLANDYASVAYWYQKEPHAPFPALPPMEARRPHMSEACSEALELHGTISQVMVKYQDLFVFESYPVPDWLEALKPLFHKGHEALHQGQYEEALASLRHARALAAESEAV